MFELKIKIIKRLLVNGNKFYNEQKLKKILKNISKHSKKNHIKSMQTVINYSSYIFKTTKLNRPFYLKDSVRIAYAIKQSLNFIKNQNSNVISTSILNKNDNFKLANKQFSETNKIFYFYRWF